MIKKIWENLHLDLEINKIGIVCTQLFRDFKGQKIQFYLKKNMGMLLLHIEVFVLNLNIIQVLQINIVLEIKKSK